MNLLFKLLRAILLVLNIFILYRLFSDEDFTRLDSAFIIIISVVGLILIIKGKYWKKGDQISFNQLYFIYMLLLVLKVRAKARLRDKSSEPRVDIVHRSFAKVQTRGQRQPHQRRVDGKKACEDRLCKDAKPVLDAKQW